MQKPISQVVISLMVLLLMSFQGRAQVIFDSTFKGVGISPVNASTAFNHLVLPNGKIIASAAGGRWDAMTCRLNPDGTIDSSYGGKGTGESELQYLNGGALLAHLPNDSIVVFGTEYSSYGSPLTIVKLDSAGIMCGNFGNGGRVRPPINTFWGAKPTALAIQPDGRILLTATIGSFFPPTVVIRLMPDGQYDTTFGKGGSLELPFGSCGFQAAGIHFQKSGKIIIAGDYFENNSRQYFGACRLKTNGEVDSTFGVNGSVYSLAFGSYSLGVLSTMLQADDKIVLSAIGGYIVRFTAQGVIDTTFGNRGSVQRPMGNGAEPRCLQPDTATGNFYVFGRYFVGTTYSGVHRLYVMRLKPSGAIDSSFNGIGYFTFPASLAGTAAFAPSMCVQNDNRILMFAASTYPSQAFLARVIMKPEVQVVENKSGIFCTGDTATLIAHTNAAVAWFRNGVATNDTGKTLRAWQSGTYHVVTTYGNGWHDTAAGVNLLFNVPVKPVIQFVNEVFFAHGGVSYQWFDSLTTRIDGATDSVFFPFMPGWYYVETIDKNGCKGRSDAIEVRSLGQKEIMHEYGISVYPNPFQDRLIIRNDSRTPVDLALFDVTGRLSIDNFNAKPGSTVLPVSNLDQNASPMYFLRIKGQGFSGVLKVFRRQ